MADSNNPTPITDAELAELDRLRAAATPGEWIGRQHQLHDGLVCGLTYCELANQERALDGYLKLEDVVLLAALHNAYPALRARLDAAELELQGWRHERAMTLTAFAHIRDGGDPALIGHPGGSVFGDALRDMLQKRLDAAEREREELRELLVGAHNQMRHLVASINYNEQRDREALAARDARNRREGAAERLERLILAHRAERPSDPFVPLVVIEQSAQRLRKGGE